MEYSLYCQCTKFTRVHTFSIVYSYAISLHRLQICRFNRDILFFRMLANLLDDLHTSHSINEQNKSEHQWPADNKSNYLQIT